MQFRILGPVEVEEEGRLLALGGAKQRALLAILLLDLNEVVSRDRLIDELWGERPPASAVHSLEVYVSRLRKTLHANGGERLLLTRGTGYLLQLEPEHLDVACFERLLGEGRRAFAAGNCERAAQRLAEALALWRGDALADLAHEPFVRLEAERLEEQRLVALEERIEAELALGRHAALIGELEALGGKHPQQERLQGQLMLALYRSGRQAEALAAYRETSQYLRDELGIDPSPALQRLEQAILRQDSVLELPPPRVAGEDGPPPVEPTLTTRPSSIDQWRPAALAVVAVGLLVGVVAGAIVFFTGSSGSSLKSVDANAVGILDSKTGKITGEVLLGGTPTQVVAGAGSIWAVTPNRQTVSRIDSTSGHVVQTIDVGSGPSGIAYSKQGRALWIANSGDGTVSRIDQATNRVVDALSVGNVPVAVTTGFGSVWVTTAGDRAVVRLNATTGSLQKVIPTGDVGRGIAIGGGAVWVSDDIRGRVSRIDPSTNEVTKHVQVGGGATALAYGAHSLWVANGLDRTVMRIDPEQNRVTQAVPISGTPGGLAFEDGDLWVSVEAGGRIGRIDPQQNKVVATIETGNRPQGIAVAGGLLWVPVQFGGVGHRGGTLRVVSTPEPFDSLDPGLGYDGPAMNVLTMLYDGLTSFQRGGNPDGTKLVADLATSLPEPSDDARTYVFHLRSGIRYSNGELVRPADFRYGIERVFSLNLGPNRKGFYDGIRGAARCVLQPKGCDLSRGIVTDPRAKTVTFHLVAPDPDFLRKLTLPFAAPVPAGTPRRETIVPATGPYHVTSYARERGLELRRNSHFREWSKAAKPDGFVDRITWTFKSSTDQEVRSVEQGRQDVAFDGVPRELAREVEIQYPGQLHPFPLWGVTYLWLNNRVPPFDDVRVRRAVNFAADREAAAPASAQDLGAQPTCQILPPNFPGFRRYCPYTRHPDSTGFWNGPNLERARRLIGASGTKGAAVTIWVPQNQTSEGPIAAALMRSLGYRTRLKYVDNGLYYFSDRGPANPRHQIQAGLNSWYADYPASSNYITLLYPCTSTANYSHFCNARIGARIRRTLTLPTTDPYTANQLWAQIDHAIVDQAPVVPLITHKRLAFVSKRVGNYEYIPHVGVLLDQLWVR